MSAISAVVLRGVRWCRWSADHRHRTIATFGFGPFSPAAIVALAAIASLVGAGCASDAERGRSIPAALTAIAADRPAPATDVIEVWICRVPTTTDDPRYGDLPLRADLTPTAVVDRIAGGVAGYFDDISRGAYRPSFIAGGILAMDRGQRAEDCVDAALDASSQAATTVLTVANAEHVADAPGGFGTSGSWFDCTESCSASRTRRAAYVGASDFGPEWGDDTPLDLVEHELGHTLGLPHSGIGPDGAYDSALDLMSNSAAPRELAAGDAAVSWDAPDTIGINRVALGWMPLADVVVLGDGSRATLGASTATAGTRLAVIELDADRLLTIELLVPTGYHGHLPAAGVAIHRVELATGRRELRTQLTLGSEPPHLELLAAGDALVIDGWRITVVELDDAPNYGTATVRLAVDRTDG